jgi:hypothetical protein
MVCLSSGDPKLRARFTRESVPGSDWYRDRLLGQQSRDIDPWTRHVVALSVMEEDAEAAGEPGI